MPRVGPCRRAVAARGLWTAASAIALTSCASWQPPSLAAGGLKPPYRYSSAIPGVDWIFFTAQRKARGSDLWPCAWAADDDLYCAWGDGGGFDGNSDSTGRVSLGFARVTGVPRPHDPTAYAGRNVWGQRPYAEVQATFGGKVSSVTAIDGLLYATADLWTASDTQDPVHQAERGPLSALIRSSDHARSWRIVATAGALARGWFIDFGRDNGATAAAPVYLYYQRPGDQRDLYFKMIARQQLLSPTPSGVDVRYFAGKGRYGKPSWVSNEARARPIFSDPRHAMTPSVVYDAPLKRFLLTVGHYRVLTGASAGQVGLFESRHPWGPWRTVAYYDDWDGLGSPVGDFLGLHLPSKWISSDGKTFWAVFSSTGVYDSFNIVQATLKTHRWWWP